MLRRSIKTPELLHQLVPHRSASLAGTEQHDALSSNVTAPMLTRPARLYNYSVAQTKGPLFLKVRLF